MTSKTPISIFWFRRDLRLQDNTALYHALKQGHPVLPIFIFDKDIVEVLPEDDPRVNFIYDTLADIDKELKSLGSSLLILKGKVDEVWQSLCRDYTISDVFFNRDYEPYARQRDAGIEKQLTGAGIMVHSFKDQVVFEPHEVLKADGNPYTVFTPYKRKWLQLYDLVTIYDAPDGSSFLQITNEIPTKNALGIKVSEIKVMPYDLKVVTDYAKYRDYPSINGTSRLGPYLRFGLVSVRTLMSNIGSVSETFTSELVWREFFMQILYHFPHVVKENFRPKYNAIEWVNDEKMFELWKSGKTGYPIVDAGMRELNQTGYMHNRVRMLTAGFLCKHLLTDWRWGEAYFAEKLMDYDLSANNGNWQWAAGTGCDAAPYFRVFNPSTQAKKFDAQLEYINKWIPELNSLEYPQPIVVHEHARKRALETYKIGLAKY
ncbi:MAG: DNA photolyase family protein [Flavobacteriales bacterium]|nr:DNA photolyase family protein [Flavobacteriales bacterium]